MRAITFTTLLALCFGPAWAQNDAQDPPPDDAAPADTTPADVPLPEKIVLPPPPEAAPTVTIRKVDNGDTVEEYREHGRITMVKVTPLRGPSYTLIDANGDGKLDRRDTEGPVAPIYWTLYEWN